MQPSTVSIASDGLVFKAFRSVGATSEDHVRPARGILLVVFVTWVPLAILSLFDGTFVGKGVEVPFLYDPAVHARLLVALPLLLLAEVTVSGMARTAVGLILERGLLPEADVPGFEARVERLARARDSRLVDWLIVAVTVALLWAGHDTIVAQRLGEHSSWLGMGGDAATLSRAGWWYFTVSVFVISSLGLRWVWWIFLWSRFLVGYLRPRLVVSPGHPDLHGGLAFLTFVQAGFALVMASFSATVSGVLAYEVLYEGLSLKQVRVPVTVALVLAMVVMFVPLLTFTGRMAGLKRRALMRYDALGQQLVTGFEQKWLGGTLPDEPLLASSDPSTYTDYVSVYASLRQMQPTPLDVKLAAVALVVAGLPFVPLVFTTMSLKELVLRMLKLLM